MNFSTVRLRDGARLSLSDCRNQQIYKVLLEEVNDMSTLLDLLLR